MTPADRTGSGSLTLLINTGTPDSPSETDVARYLREFLNDPNIMGMPEGARRLLVDKMIVPGRVRASAARYRRLWRDNGGRSPLLVHTGNLARALTVKLAHPVLPVMRYGTPGPREIADEVLRAEVITLVPLFPQQTYSSYTSALDHLADKVTQLNPDAQLRFCQPYYAHEAFIKAVADVARPHLAADLDLVVISFHAIPETHQLRGIREGVDYDQQCRVTAHLLARELGVPDDRLRVTYQSAIRPMPWLQPQIETEALAWPRSGHRRVAVVCPGFASDCLETSYDIGSKLRDRFIKAGGERFTLVPAVNDDARWVAALATILESQLVAGFPVQARAGVGGAD